MGAPNTTNIPKVTIRELDELIYYNARMYNTYNKSDFEERYFRERIRFLNSKKESLLKKIARDKKLMENASNETK